MGVTVLCRSFVPSENFIWLQWLKLQIYNPFGTPHLPLLLTQVPLQLHSDRTICVYISPSLLMAVQSNILFSLIRNESIIS